MIGIRCERGHRVSSILTETLQQYITCKVVHLYLYNNMLIGFIIMKVNQVAVHQDMSGGISYEYNVEFSGNTVNEVLKEIKEYTNNDNRFERILDFGNIENDAFGAWAIYINRKVFLSCWIGEMDDEHRKYTGNGTEKVISIKGYGGWYSGINFHITTE